MQTVRVIGVVAVTAFVLVVRTPSSYAQSDTRQRQAAAEAYDQGTAAYLSGDYEKAAEWFETANRMSPAAPALIQAARAHQQAGHLVRAATLALRLTLEHNDDATAMQFGQGLLERLAPQFVRIDVNCDNCKLALDGALQDSASFYVEPGVHSVSASFDTGERKADVSGEAGENKQLSFEAPPPPPPQETGEPNPDQGTGHKPLPPVYTIVGASIAGALVIGSVISTLDMNAGVDPYKEAAKKYTDCFYANNMMDAPCRAKMKAAFDKLDSGRGKETRTTVLWIATGTVAVATAVIAVAFTDWSGGGDKPSSEHALRFGAAPNPTGMTFAMQGKF